MGHTHFVLAGALVTMAGLAYSSRFSLFRSAGIPNRLIPAAIALGTSTFTMSALPGTPAIQNAIPMLFFGHDAAGRARSGHHRVCDHDRFRSLVAQTCRRGGPAQERRLWPGVNRYR